MRVIQVWISVSNAFFEHAAPGLSTNYVRAWDEVTLAGDEGVVAVRGFARDMLL